MFQAVSESGLNPAPGYRCHLGDPYGSCLVPDADAQSVEMGKFVDDVSNERPSSVHAM